MKKRGLISLFLLPLAGCLAPAPKAPVNWTVEWAPSAARVSPRPAKAPAAKLLSVDVRAPYNTTRLPVLRADGSIAFDGFNGFAAPPAALLRAAAQDVLSASGAFDRVLAPGSTAVAPLALELTVTRLALDCRAQGRRDASVALVLTVVGRRTVLDAARGEAAVPVAGGDYSAAFSAAFSEALLSAVHALAPQK